MGIMISILSVTSRTWVCIRWIGMLICENHESSSLYKTTKVLCLG